MWLHKICETYKIKIQGKVHALSAEQIESLIKSELRKSITFQKLCQHFETDPHILEGLSVEIVSLDQKYAETDDKIMKLNEVLFKNGDFFEKYLFIPFHEIIHFLTRNIEKKTDVPYEKWPIFRRNADQADKIRENSYFEDKEEILGFVSSTMMQIEREGVNSAWNKVFPKIEWHFQDECKAKNFFIEIINDAKRLLH